MASRLMLFFVFLGIIANGSPYLVVTRFDEELPEFDSESGTPFKNCGGSRSVLKSVEVIPCNLDHNTEHCVLDRGTNVTFKMSFLAKENSKTLDAKIFGIIDYIPIPFPCPEPNACKNSGISCPVVNGKIYEYTLSAPVSQKYPKTSLWIKGELRDAQENVLVCIEIPVKIE